jgi:hypothetical protein
MKLYHLCCKNGMYKDAEKIARTAKAIYPENPAAEAALHVAKMLYKKEKPLTTKHVNKTKKVKKAKAPETCLPPLSPADAYAPVPSAVCPDPCEEKWNHHSCPEKPERKPAPSSEPCMPKVDSSKEVSRKLSTPVTVNFQDTKFSQVMDDLEEISGLSIIIDKAAKDGISLDQHVSLKRERASFKDVLNTILNQVHLTYVVRDGAVVITPE